ncbi:hypothetical protein HF086_016776 [Spodoptera exigua]|uniref:Uncharacterized protein n=1 Tax=Spodoptera exigua TaxID=7107 RepID=A0A922ML70_SPOEX|nr:hypothetical protein HF086_016776 [Spodoptera exigua]
MFQIFIFLLLSLVSTSCAKKEPKIVDMFASMKISEKNESLSARNVQTSYLVMPVDHYNHLNSDTFRLRFMYNEEFFGGDGSPIFVTIAGDWHISPNWLTRGNMYEMARQNKGYQVYVEHRYYGESQVFEKLTIENLRFLNVNQALADLAYFIGELKRQPRFANSKVILYGPAYAGKLALWFKKRYPHLAVGSVVSSAAILAKVDIGEQLEVVHEAFLLEGGEQCIAHIREGIEETVAALKTENGKRNIEEVYSLCDPLDNAMDLGRFSGIIAWTFINFVLNSRPGQIKDICKNFDGNNYGTTPMQQIAGFVAAATGTETDITCFSSSFEVFINLYMNMDSKKQLEVVHEAFLLEGGEQCIAHIREGIEETVAALKTENGKRIVEEVYRLENLSTYLLNILFCLPIGTTPMQQIAGFVAAATGTETDITCFSSSFEVFINLYMNMDSKKQLEVVHEAFLLEGGEQCIAHIREGIEETVAALKTENGKRIVEEVYSLCDPLDNAMDLGRFSGIIAWTFINFVLNSRPGQIKDICKNFDGNNYGTTPMQQIAGFVAAATGTETDITCFSSSFEVFINLYMNMDSKMSHRAILFQTCTEFGYFQTAPKSGTVFDDLTWLNIDFYNEICLRSFDKR